MAGSQSLTATGRHLPYGITQSYMPPDTSERTRPTLTPASKPVLYLPTPEGWKAELTEVAGYISRWCTCPDPYYTLLILELCEWCFFISNRIE